MASIEVPDAVTIYQCQGIRADSVMLVEWPEADARRLQLHAEELGLSMAELLLRMARWHDAIQPFLVGDRLNVVDASGEKVAVVLGW